MLLQNMNLKEAQNYFFEGELAETAKLPPVLKKKFEEESPENMMKLGKRIRKSIINN
jgi:hypothetical protein